MDTNIITGIFTLVGALGGAIVGFAGTYFATVKSAEQQKQKEKRERLSDAYKKLLSVIYLFPENQMSQLSNGVEDLALKGLKLTYRDFGILLSSIDSQIHNLVQSEEVSMKAINLIELKNTIIPCMEQYKLACKKYQAFKDYYYIN